MRVIDQNGCDYPYESIAISYGDGIIYARPVSNMDKRYLLARYSTQQKADKAMRNLHEAYAQKPLFIHENKSPQERATLEEIRWAKTFDEMNTNMIISPIHNRSIECVNTGNIIFRFPQDDEIEGEVK